MISPLLAKLVGFSFCKINALYIIYCKMQWINSTESLRSSQILLVKTDGYCPLNFPIACPLIRRIVFCIVQGILDLLAKYYSKTFFSKSERSLVFKAVKLWNCLHEYLKKIQDCSNFTTRVKHELLLRNINFPE